MAFELRASIDTAAISNPTYEFFPPKAINGFNGTQIPSPFLRDTLNANHFPVIFTLPDGKLFVAANNASMIFDWRTNTEVRLPHFPNDARITLVALGDRNTEVIHAHRFPAGRLSQPRLFFYHLLPPMTTPQRFLFVVVLRSMTSILSQATLVRVRHTISVTGWVRAIGFYVDLTRSNYLQF